LSARLPIACLLPLRPDGNSAFPSKKQLDEK
jgi:hypothetical protein